MGVYNIGGQINEIYPYMIDAVLAAPEVPSRNGSTRELHPAMIEVYEPRRRLLTAFGRPVNVPFALAEVLWILGGRDDVEMLSFYNSKIHEYSDDGERFNAAYGYRLRKGHGHDQLNDMIECLRNDPGSRQAILNIWHPPSDRSYVNNRLGNSYSKDNPPVKHTTKDRACNVLSHALIRGGTLDWTQIIRSNDIMWGAPYNWMQWTHVMEYVANAVGVPLGHMFYMADSLHIYDYHWQEAEDISAFDLYAATGHEHAKLESKDAAIKHLLEAEAVIRVSESVRDALNFWDNWIDKSLLGEYWCSVLEILTAHRLFKNKADDAALSALLSADDPVYAAATMRFWYGIRWGKDGYGGKTMEDTIDNHPWGNDASHDAIAAWIRA